MCDQATQTILDKIVADFVSRGLMFTALNVSREAQKNHGVTLRHNDMKNETHRVYAGGTMQNYDRKLIDIPNVNGQAYCYHPDNTDPDNYDLSQLSVGPIDTKDAAGTISSNSVPVPALVGASLATTLSPGPYYPGTSTKGKYAVDKRKRLWIPRDMLRNVGLRSGDVAAVTLDGVAPNRKLVVTTTNAAASATSYTSYKVDSKGNIAISKAVFDAAALSESSYDILTMNGQVVVKKA